MYRMCTSAEVSALLLWLAGLLACCPRHALRRSVTERLEPHTEILQALPPAHSLCHRRKERSRGTSSSSRADGGFPHGIHSHGSLAPGWARGVHANKTSLATPFSSARRPFSSVSFQFLGPESS